MKFRHSAILGAFGLALIPAAASAQNAAAPQNNGLPMWRNAMPWKNTPLTPNIGLYAQTDDIRPGMGFNGVDRLSAFVANGGVLVGVYRIVSPFTATVAKALLSPTSSDLADGATLQPHDPLDAVPPMTSTFHRDASFSIRRMKRRSGSRFSLGRLRR